MSRAQRHRRPGRLQLVVVALVSMVLVASGAGAQTEITLTAAPGTVEIEPGVSAAGWFFDGQLPGPAIRLTEGETLRTRFINALPEESTIHWHGIPVPFGMDGVPGVSRPPVLSGQEFTYEFVADTPGVFFYHPHVGLQLDQGLYGVVIVDPVSYNDPPYDAEFVLVLDDLLPGAPIMGQNPVYSDHLINGRNSAGQAPLVVQQGDQVRLRFVNAAAGTNYVVAIDGHPMTVTHTDGRPVQPVTVDALPIGAGERYDVYVTADNFGTWSIAAARIQSRYTTLVRAILEYQGSTQPTPASSYVPPSLSTGALLSYSQLAHAGPVTPIAAAPDRTHAVVLTGSPSTYIWAMNGESFPNITPLPMVFGEHVQLDMVSSAPMYHPMHLHGHFYRLMGTAGGTTLPPEKDTVLLGPGFAQPSGNSISVQVLADNPGSWMYHCHHLYHAHGGMMTLMQYQSGDQDVDGLDDSVDFDPMSAYPVLMADDLGNGFAIGTSFQLDAQWQPGETVTYFIGDELPAPADLGLIGSVALWPVAPLGSATTTVDAMGSLPISIPLAPVLTGARATFQAVATHGTLAPNYRLSTVLPITLQ